MIQFENVGFRYGRSDETLRDLSFGLEVGSFHFLTGASGAGKTSLLRLLYLDSRPTRGRLKIFSRDVSQFTRDDVAMLRRRIGVVFQDFRLLDHLTAAENVALPLRVAGVPEQAYRDDVAEMLDWVDLGDRMTARPPELSGGEKQRLAIARAVVAAPDLLLADEPTGSVDPEMAGRIMRLFVEMNRMGKTVLIASHDIGLIARHPFPVIKLKDGMLDEGARPKPEAAP